MRIFIHADELAPGPRKKYDEGVVLYKRFCSDRKLNELDPSSAILFCQSQPSTATRWVLRRIFGTVRRYFLDNDCDDPLGGERGASCLRDLFRHSRRCFEHPPYAPGTYRRIIDSIPSTPAGRRDKALVGLIYTGRPTLRELELLDPEHCTFSNVGLHAVLVASPKRNALRLKRFPDPAYCAVALLENYYEMTGYQAPGFRVARQSGITELRLSYDGMAVAIKRRLNDAGLKPSIISLRGSMIAVAAARGAIDDDIVDQGDVRCSRTLKKWKQRGNVASGFDLRRMDF